MSFFKISLFSCTILRIFVVLAASYIGLAHAEPIVVEGNTRTESEVVRSYFKGTTPGQVNEAYKDLMATGLFSDVQIRRESGRIVVRLHENELINRVVFEGNSKVKSDQLTGEIQSKSRGPYSPTLVEADVQRILDIYTHAGRRDARVTSRIVPLPNGRVDVVFTITEGDKTGVKSIEFRGNQAFSEYRLKNLMQTTEMNVFSFLKSSDVYDPDRISADEELIRRFYLKNGYIDFHIIGSDVRYDPEQRGYIVTITLDEGVPYRISNITVDSHLNDVDPAVLQSEIRLSAGEIYDADLVTKSTEGITRKVAQAGYAFSSVRPRIERDPAQQTAALTFVVEEGPRVYIERINVRGNTRTRDYVIRREFDIGEGDAYNRVLVDRAERRLNNLGFLKKVKISNEPGSAPDRVVLNVDVEDQPTGSFGISGGYSSTDGIIGELSVSETNFMGRGQYVRAAVSGGQYTRGVEFNFTEPYFMGQRLAAGFDLFVREQKSNQYSIYDSRSAGGTLRLGFPLTDELVFSPHYSLYKTRISIPNTATRPYNDCSVAIPDVTPTSTSTPPLSATNNCLTNGEASLAIKEMVGDRTTSLGGYSLTYSTIDNVKTPTTGIFAQLTQDVAGLGGDAKFIRTVGDARYYYPLYGDIIGFIRLQGGHQAAFGGTRLLAIDNFNPGPNLVRGFAPGGFGPRDASDPYSTSGNTLGGTRYFGGTLEAQFPLFGAPKELGLRGAVFADAGTLFGYKGRTDFTSLFGGGPCTYYTTQSPAPPGFTNTSQGTCINVTDSHKIRSSAGVSLLWDSPLGPIRFDYAFVLSKAPGDQKQAFRFSGGASF